MDYETIQQIAGLGIYCSLGAGLIGSGAYFIYRAFELVGKKESHLVSLAANAVVGGTIIGTTGAKIINDLLR